MKCDLRTTAITESVANESESNVIKNDHNTKYINQDEVPHTVLNERPVGLRRKPTKYPHGLGISVQTISDNYSRASTLRGSWNMDETNGRTNATTVTNHMKNVSQHHHNKYRISMLSNSENLSELQVRRLKYPLTGNYYLDTQESTNSTLLLFDYVKRFSSWKCLRWPIIITSSVLLFFGLITYCIWLYDVSVTREHYLQKHSLTNVTFIREDTDLKNASAQGKKFTLSITEKTTNLLTDHNHGLHESTILRAIGGSRSRYRPKEQKLTTIEYDVSKGSVEWEKIQKDEKVRGTISPETATLATEEAALVPANVVRFTSGHQNSFGIPIEEDERILKLLNGLFPFNQQESSTSEVLAKVSPTIPPVVRSKPTLSMSATRTTAQDNGCYSTSLTMCQGVLDYDLTYNSTTKLNVDEKEAYENLINSNCSGRAVEFICTTLEPECRPLHIGVLSPCRRICKAILEACSIIIANSDILSAIFDCNLYPDSNDSQKCEDPTRRHDYCYDNEFQCYDQSCLPSSWQCDNIKDCATGEDEENCLICEHQDEFRCRSNEKCLPQSVRCDSKYDCFDGSDEEDCDEYGSSGESTFDEAALNTFPRIFSYASFLSPNQSNDKLYITATNDDKAGLMLQVHEISNRTSGVSNEEVTNIVPGDGPKGLVNFRDSKEIMMTSDTENKFKYSSARSNHTISKFSAHTTPLKPEASVRVIVTTEAPAILGTCAAHQLRCVSGKCITVNQLCDKKIDCPDGADELMCVYKNRTTTPTQISTVAAITTSRPDKRTIRTTIKRKIKTR